MMKKIKNLRFNSSYDDTLSTDITVLTGDQIWSEGVIDSGRVYKKLMEYLNRYDTQIATTFVITIQRGISNVQTYALLRTNILPTMYRKS